MDERISEIVQGLLGLKYYEWSRIKIAVEKQYASMSNRLELNDLEALEKQLRLEITGNSTR